MLTPLRPLRRGFALMVLGALAGPVACTAELGDSSGNRSGRGGSSGSATGGGAGSGTGSGSGGTSTGSGTGGSSTGGTGVGGAGGSGAGGAGGAGGGPTALCPTVGVNAGPSVLRRLSVLEYQLTLQDLVSASRRSERREHSARPGEGRVSHVLRAADDLRRSICELIWNKPRAWPMSCSPTLRGGPRSLAATWQPRVVSRPS